MKKIIFLIICIAAFSYSYSQDPTVKELQTASTKAIKTLDSNGWKKSGTFILNLNQGALSNWVAGGEENVLGINSILNYSLNYRTKKYLGQLF